MDYFRFEAAVARATFEPWWRFVRTHVIAEALWSVFWGGVSLASIATSAGGGDFFEMIQAGALGAIKGLAALLSIMLFYFGAKAPYVVWQTERWQSAAVQAELKELRTNIVSGSPSRISLLDFAKEAQRQGWKVLDLHSLETLDLERGLYQACVDKAIPVWGKEYDLDFLMRDNPLKALKPDVWERYKIDLTSVFITFRREGVDYIDWVGSNATTCMKARGSEEVKFADIHLGKLHALAWLERDAAVYKGQLDAEYAADQQPVEDASREMG